MEVERGVFFFFLFFFKMYSILTALYFFGMVFKIIDEKIKYDF